MSSTRQADPSAERHHNEWFNIASACLHHADDSLDEVAALVTTDGAGCVRTLSYRALREAAQRVASGLRRGGANEGDRVVLWMENSADYAAAFFGVVGGGMVAVPASAALSAREISFLTRDAGARALIHDATHTPPGPSDGGNELSQTVDAAELRRWIAGGASAEPFVETDADTPAFLIYTSGTTGDPKGVLHGHRMLLGRLPMRDGWTGIGRGDIVLHAGKLNWTYTLGVGLMDPLWAGGTSVLYTGENDPTVWPRLIRQNDVTIFATVPTLYRQILKYATPTREDFAGVRHCLTAGEALSPALAARWQDATGTELFEALGMSECSTYISSGPATPIKPGSPGRAQPGRRIAVLPLDGGREPVELGQRGLLAVHRTDPGLMLGYWNRPEEEADVFRGDWFVGGDVVALDEDGYVTFHGRADDLLNSFGHRVSPIEIEQVLVGHRAIREAAVTSVEVRPDVPILVAFVVLAVDAGARPTSDALATWAAERLADYKMPRGFVFVDALPRTRTGKVKRSALAALWNDSNAR